LAEDSRPPVSECEVELEADTVLVIRARRAINDRGLHVIFARKRANAMSFADLARPA
jgi:DNA-binding cell septation regulator SpoVG